MIDIFKVFYPVHYNFGAFALLLLLLVIFLLTKKNFKWAIIFFVIDLAFNVVIYQKTINKVWTIIEEPEASSEYDRAEQITYKFSAPDHWTIKSDDGKIFHWCWVENYVEKFLSFDFVDKLWGSKQAKKMRQASEERLNQ